LRRANVYYRGEELTGKIRATYYYGAPLVGREIQYTLAGDDRCSGKTDDKGESPSSSTRSRRGPAAGHRDAPRATCRRRVVFLATQGFRIETTTPRVAPYLAGDRSR
jgi:hypothetical protein